MSTDENKEMTWTKAILFGFAIAAASILVFGFLPSEFTYWWERNTDNIVALVGDVTGQEIEQYTSVRIRDAISMGFQTVLFVIPIVATYIIMERRRRRLGQRGFEGVKEYMPGK